MALEFKICAACKTRHAVQRSGLMSIHVDPSGVRCTGAVHLEIMAQQVAVKAAAAAAESALRSERIDWRKRRDAGIAARAAAEAKKRATAELAQVPTPVAAPPSIPSSAIPTGTSGVVIRCPACGSQVRLLRGGHVQAHGAPLCTFIRTASNSVGLPRVDQSARERPGGTLERNLTQTAEVQRQDRLTKAAKFVAKTASPKSKAKWIAKRGGRLRCPKCANRAGAVGDGSGLLKAHKQSATLWCSNGIQPTPEVRKSDRDQRKNAWANRQKHPAAKRSVWAFSGGLPSHGRRY